MSDSDQEENETSSSGKESSTMEAIRHFFAQKFSLNSEDSDSSSETKVINDLTFDGLMKHWKEKGFKNVITMVGAGISTSAEIPDFRSPGSGLYDNLEKYNLPRPSAVFELDYFHENPKPFFALAKELYPGTFFPTPSHYFVRLLHDKGLLLRHYTQNIDTLERIAGIPDEKLVEAHGTFYTNHCLGCSKAFSMEWMKEQIFLDVVPSCDECNAVVKPDIVFFGENLPNNFYTLPAKDFKKCDLLIIMGTSLEVHPFASLVDKAGSQCIRLLVNRTKVGSHSSMSSWFMFGPGLMFDHEKNTRDIAYIGDCDDGAQAIADALGWGEELRKLIDSEHKRLREETEKSDQKSTETVEEEKDVGTEKDKVSKKSD